MEVDLQWLRAHLFRSPLEKDPIDHSDSESHDSEVYRLPHPKFLSASLVWEIHRDTQKELLGFREFGAEKLL